MSNSPLRNQIAFAVQAVALFVGIGLIVNSAALIGGVFVSCIAGASVGLLMAPEGKSRSGTVIAAISGIESGAITALVIRALGEGAAAVAAGTVVFAIVGYALWFLGKSCFECHRRV